MDTDEFSQSLTPFGRALPKLAGMSLDDLMHSTDPDVLAAQAYIHDEMSRPPTDHYCTPHGHC